MKSLKAILPNRKETTLVVKANTIKISLTLKLKIIKVRIKIMVAIDSASPIYLHVHMRSVKELALIV